MILHEKKLSLAGAPVWLVFAEDAHQAAQRGTILFWHGLGASKDVQGKELYGLAQQGWLAVGIDNVGHGERRLPDFEQRFAGWNSSVEDTFLGLVRSTAQEAPHLIDALIEANLARPDRIGAAGISMGAYILYRALLVDRRIRTAVAILGSPRWRQAWAESPHLHVDAFFPTALLSQTAGADQSVPPRFARELHEQLSSRYQSAPERQRYIEFPGVGHFMPEDLWNELWHNSVDWFHRFLAAPTPKPVD